MIPVAILIGLLAGLAAGRLGWWAVGIVAVAWPVVLIATNVDSGLTFFAGAAALAAVNTSIGVAVGIAGRWRTRRRCSCSVISSSFLRALDVTNLCQFYT